MAVLTSQQRKGLRASVFGLPSQRKYPMPDASHAANAPTALAEVDVAALNRLAGQCLAAQTLDIPTAVGFCMYIRRDCLARTGWFDADAFGTGYGEENDFCLRAAVAGWPGAGAG